MSKLTTKQRSGLRTSEFALPGRRFPINDKNHAEAAERMAPRALHAGSISSSQLHSIDRKAAKKLSK